MLVVGYNAPYAYGTYKKYTAAIDRGDMAALHWKVLEAVLVLRDWQWRRIYFMMDL